MSSADLSVKKIGVHLLFVLLLSYLIALCDIWHLPWNVTPKFVGWQLMFLLLIFWMVRRGSRVACSLIIVWCLFNLLFSLIGAYASSRSSIFKSGFFLAAAVSYGVFVIQLLIAVFRKKFPADSGFLKKLNLTQWGQLFRNRNSLIRLIRRFFTPFYLIFAALALIGSAYTCWYNFHPKGSIKSIDGPAGNVNRAFFEEVGFRHSELNLYAADWPYTFHKPFSIGDDDGLENRLHWSADGSLLFRAHQGNKMEESYISALYDYREHQSYDFSSPVINMTKLERLIKERGGLGPVAGCLWE
jgi:hypothetical protein